MKLSRSLVPALAAGLGLVVSLASAPAHAEHNGRKPKVGSVGMGPYQGATGYVIAPESSFTAESDPISKIIFLNRCAGGCTITGGTQNDARTNTSTIPDAGTYTVSQWAFGDDDWNALVSCVRDVYSPFDVTVTDVDPGNNVLHHEAIVAGNPGDIGLGNDILGVAATGADCIAHNNAISFTFANHHANFHRIDEICSTVAQESAHAFGLDHALDCSDPMTYLPYCGRKFFRNENLTCGEDVARDCKCGGLQNSHAMLTGVFGPHEPSTPPPTVALTNPQNGATVTDHFAVIARASDVRGITHVDYYFNGYKWGSKEGAAFGAEGQPESSYTFSTPDNLPDGKIDVVVKAYNDLEIETATTQVTVSKGADCQNAATDCLTGQKCEQGRCFWDPPAGQLGDECEYPQFCESERCETDGEQKLCTQGCFAGVEGSCPDGYECLITGGTQGVCWPQSDSSGCCSTSTSDDRSPWTYAGVSGLVLAVMLRRRRRPSARR